MKTSIRVKEIISTKRRLLFCLLDVDLVYCFIMCLPPALHNIFHMPRARYSRFVLKMPLYTNKLFCLAVIYQTSYATDPWCSMSLVSWHIWRDCSIEMRVDGQTPKTTVYQATLHKLQILQQDVLNQRNKFCFEVAIYS